MNFEEIRKVALKGAMEELDQKILSFKEKGAVIPKIREFEIVFQHILTGFGIPQEVDDTILEKPEVVESLQKFTKGRVEGTSLNTNENDLFKKFADHLSKDEDFVTVCLDLLEAAHKEEPIYIHDYVHGALTRLLDARK